MKRARRLPTVTTGLVVVVSAALGTGLPTGAATAAPGHARLAATTATLTLAAPATAEASPDGFALSGRLRLASGKAMPHRKVQVWTRDTGAKEWSWIGNARTNSRGLWREQVAPTQSTRFQARFAGSGFRPARSAAVATTITYPAYVAPTATTKFVSCTYTVNPDGETADVKVTMDDRLDGGVWQYELPGFFPNIEYHYQGEPDEATNAVELINEWYDPNRDLVLSSFPRTRQTFLVYEPGPWDAKGYHTMRVTEARPHYSDCTQTS